MKVKCPKCQSKRTEYNGYEYSINGAYPIHHCRKCNYDWIVEEELEPVEWPQSMIDGYYPDEKVED
jgi:hypothetical protein